MLSSYSGLLTNDHENGHYIVLCLSQFIYVNYYLSYLSQLLMSANIDLNFWTE